MGDNKNEGKRRSGCSCGGCLGFCVFILTAMAAGYFLREWEGSGWNRSQAVAAMRARAVVYYDQLKARFFARPAEKPAARDLEPDTEPEEIPVNSVAQGDAAYARARQASFKLNGAAVNERRQLTKIMVRELTTAAQCYQTALMHAGNDAALRNTLAEKLQTTRKALADLQKSR